MDQLNLINEGELIAAYKADQFAESAYELKNDKDDPERVEKISKHFLKQIENLKQKHLTDRKHEVEREYNTLSLAYKESLRKRFQTECKEHKKCPHCDK